MNRDIDRLTGRTFDVLVVGGGIHGLAIAYDAAQRGLSVALIEREDFGGGNSFNHLRTLHGGLRYLQTLEIRRARRSILERRTIAAIAPQAVRPLTFVLPLTPSLVRGKTALRGALFIDRLLGFDRNRGLPASLWLPPGRVISRREALAHFPLLAPDLAGAAVWHDYETLEADRLTLAFALAAWEQGAVLANYVEAVAPVAERRVVSGVRAVDQRSGRELEIAARVTVNATGSGINRLPGTLGVTGEVPMLRAMNLVTARPGGEAALGGRTPSGRHVFLVPWRGRALFGTWESTAVQTPGALEAESARFLDALNGAFPSLALQAREVTFIHQGLVPARMANGVPHLEGHDRIDDHSRDGVRGLLSIAGTKYTTARAVAEIATTRLLVLLGQSAVPCRTAATPLPGVELTESRAAPGDVGGALDGESLSHLVAAYGARYQRLVELAALRPEWGRRLAEGCPVVGAELVWAVREEMALTLADTIIRRTPLGALGYPGDAAVNAAATIVGHERGWSDEDTRREVAAVKQFYVKTP